MPPSFYAPLSDEAAVHIADWLHALATRFENHYSRKALEEARASGTAVVCLCVGGSQEADKLRAVFGVANLLIVDELRQMTTQIRNVRRQALAGVSKRKLTRASG